jgi:hypothetical protein
LKPSINTKELCKQIKASGNRGFLIWGKEENQNFITNRHFLVRFEVLPNDVLAALFSVFYKLPNVGETLQAQFGEIINSGKSIDFRGIYHPEQQSVKGFITQYVRDIDKKITARLIKFPNHYSFVNSDFMNLLEIDKTEDLSPSTSGDNSHLPIYFANKNLILLPYRFSDGKILIEDLLGAELDGKDVIC